MTRRLTLTPIVDPEKAIQGVRKIGGAMSGVTGALGGVEKKGRASFSGLAAAMSNSGLLNEFGGIQSTLLGMSGAFGVLGEKGKVSFAKIAISAGVGMAALGGVGEQLGAPLEMARAQLDQSLKNAGSSLNSSSPAIVAAEKQMQGLGFTYQDTDAALARLTQGFNSPKKALRELGLTANIAARNNANLTSSSQLVVRSYAGSTRVLRQFGVNTTQMTLTANAAKAAQKARTAVTDLARAEKRLLDLQQRLGASQGSKGASDANRVATAQAAVAAAGERLAAVQAKISGGSVKATTAQGELQAAQLRLASATARLTAAQGKQASSGTLTISQQQELTNAEQTLAATRKKSIETDRLAVATRKDLNKAHLSGIQILDVLNKKTRGLAAAQSKTFGGDMRKWKADVEDFGATMGAKLGKDLIMIGPALAGVGTLVDVGFFGKIGQGAKGLGRLLTKPISSLNDLKLGAGDAGKAAAGAEGGVAGMGEAATTATPGIEGAGTAAATATGEEVGMGEAAATAAPEIAGMGEAAATATPELAAEGAAASAAGAEGAAAGAAGAAGAGEAAAGAGMGLKGAVGVGAGALGTVAAGAAALYGGYQVGGMLNKKLGISNTLAGWFGADRIMSHSQLTGVSRSFDQKRLATLASLSAPSSRTLGGMAAYASQLGMTNVSQLHDSHLSHADAEFLAQALARDLASQHGSKTVTGAKVAHYHDEVHIASMTVHAADLHDFKRQVVAEQRHANFSGTGATR